MKKLASMIGLVSILVASPVLAETKVVYDNDQFVNDLTGYVHNASAIEHDGIWKVATNVPFGVGIIYEQVVRQGDHNGLDVVVGSQCDGCVAHVQYYDNGGGTYNTITTYVPE